MRYLLGAASAEEEQRLEERYFSDDSYFELLVTVEEELIDAYVSAEMSRDERQRFEQHFLSSPQRRQRVAFAQALLASAARRSDTRAPGVIGRERPPRSWLFWRWVRIPQPVMQVLILACFALLAVAGSLSIIQSWRLRDQLTGVQAQGQDLRQQIEQERVIQQQLSAALDQERIARNRLEQTLPNSPPQTIVSFILRAGTARSAEDVRALLIRQGTDVVQLQLDLEREGNGQYQVAVRTADDQEVWSQDGLRPRNTAGGGAVVLSLPANLLVSGDYIIMLRTLTPRGDIEDAGQYMFRTIRR
jgi:hypothetical protein